MRFLIEVLKWYFELKPHMMRFLYQLYKEFIFSEERK